MKKKLIFTLSTVYIVSSMFIGCQSVVSESIKRVTIDNELKKMRDDLKSIKLGENFKFDNNNILYIFELTKNDLINKFGEATLMTEGISGKGIECEIYNFKNSEVTAAIDKETELVKILTFQDNSIEHIKDIKIGDSIEIAISKILDRVDFDIDSAKKVLEWDGGYYSELYGDIKEDMVHSYSLVKPIGYIVYQDLEKGFTKIVLKDEFYEITISIENNVVLGISYCS